MAEITGTSQQADSAYITALLADIFHRRGAESYLGENLTIAEHMLQSAKLATEAGSTTDIIVAALLHDVGHYTHEFPENAADLGIDSQHDEAGAAVLAPWFPKTVVDCVRLHVDAKRYLCATEPEYFASLSDASKHSLSLQGGPMSSDEVAVFAQQSNLTAILNVRRWDDQAKVPGLEAGAFSDYLPQIQAVVESHLQSLAGGAGASNQPTA